MADADDPDDPGQARRQARRTTAAGIAGVLLIALGVGMSLLDVGGLVAPTVLAILGVGALLAAVVTGAQQIAQAYKRPDDDFWR
ncbi:hypothetical protein [Microlunatus flavus]|uniref:Uncharacterized protein n=1 Tax=Microlunatus flavus TaxID=1036181 RepID=A0A1H9KG74_9ACTN|nr:hypothetical protein [Microlunatus flavus]SEQ98122.1 hypothetical protein SAMN05421756_107204 [Microlunatus flavus]